MPAQFPFTLSRHSCRASAEFRQLRGAVPFGLALALSAGCARAPAPAAADHPAVALATADRAAYEATIAKLTAENKRLDHELFAARSGEPPEGADVAGDAGDAEAGLNRCQADLARYRAGLERAVAELNARGVTAQLPPPSRPRPAADTGFISSRLGPTLQILGDRILVTGELWSYRNTTSAVRLHLDLLEDGNPIDSADLQLQVPANTDQTYSYTFYLNPIDGRVYSARADVDY